MTFGEYLKTKIEESKYSEEDISKLLSVPLFKIYEWESDKEIPSDEYVSKLNEILGTSLQSTEIFQKDEKKRKNWFTWTKFLLIFGAIITPMVIGGAIVNSINSLSSISTLALLDYFITIPICVFSIKAITKEGIKDNEIKKWGVLALLFCSLLGGILILTAPSGYIPYSKKIKK